MKKRVSVHSGPENLKKSMPKKLVKSKSKKLKENPLPNLDVRFPTEALIFRNKNQYLGKKSMKDSKSAKLLVYRSWAP